MRKKLNSNIAMVFYCAATMFLTLGFNVWWQSAHWPVYLLSPSLAKSEDRKASIQMFSGLVALAITTLISYWFPMSGVIIISSLEILWVILAIGSEEELVA
jgi:hypothetical protein